MNQKADETIDFMTGAPTVGSLDVAWIHGARSVLGSQTNGTPQTAATFYGEILDTIYTPRDFNEAPNALLWPSHLARIYAKAADTTNQPMRQPPDVEALDKYVTNQIPSGFTQGTGTLMSDLFVGNFEQLLIGQRLDLQIQTLTERYAELGQVGILATWRGDVQLARAGRGRRDACPEPARDRRPPAGDAVRPGRLVKVSASARSAVTGGSAPGFTRSSRRAYPVLGC